MEQRKLLCVASGFESRSLGELKDCIDKEPYKKINEDFMARWLARIVHFKAGNKAFINEGYGF